MTTIATMTAAYNEITGESRKKFPSRAAAEERLAAAAAERQLAVQTDAEGGISFAPLAEVASLTRKERAILIAYLELGIESNGAETVDDMLADNMTWGDVPTVAAHTETSEASVKGVIASLERKGLLVITNEGVNGEGPVQQVLSDTGVRRAFDCLAEPEPTGKPGRAPKYADDAVITVLAESNPKREGTPSHERFAQYKTGQTVAEAIALGVRRADVRWDVDHGFISVA